MSCNGGHESRQIVSSFEDADQLALGVRVGKLQAEAGDVGKVILGESQATDGVLAVSVESG